MRGNRIPWIMLFLLGGFAAGYAQELHYNFSHLDVEKGLSDSRVECFLKDQQGFIWIGTLGGLNRFDGYNLTIFKNDPRDTNTLSQSNIKRIFEDPKGRMWVTTVLYQNVYDPSLDVFHRNTTPCLKDFGLPPGTLRTIVKGAGDRYWFAHSTAGLFRYSNGVAEKISHSREDTTTISTDDLSSLAEDGKGGLWIVHKNGILEKLNIESGKIAWRTQAIARRHSYTDSEYNLTVDAEGDVWIYASYSNKGLFYYNGKSDKLTHLGKNSDLFPLNENIVNGVIQDDRGLIWVATDHGGINVIDKEKQTIRYILNNEEDEKSLGQNSINTLYKDREGFIWAGTFKKGVSYYHRNLIRFPLFRHRPSDLSSLPYNDINAFAEDDKGNLWIGTNDQGLLYFDRTRNSFTKFQHDPSNENSLSGNVIVSLFFDRKKTLWIGTYYYGLNSYRDGHFTRYKHSEKDSTSLSDDNIWELYEDSQERLWIGTLASGVDLMDRSSGTFRHYRPGVPNSVHTGYVAAIIEDREGAVWFGTGYGLDVLPKGTDEFKHYLNDFSNPKSLSHNNVISIVEDNRRNIWVGTTEGLNVFDRRTQTFRVFTTEQGLPHNTILTLQEDNSGNLWMGTANGISNLLLSRGIDNSILSFQFRNYTESDGLQGKQFNEGASLKTRSGEMVFGGSNGFNIFNPADIELIEIKPVVRISDFQILNKTVRVGEEIEGRVILEKDINFTPEIVLNHSSNVFSLEFVALNYFNPEKIHYKYMLKEFNKDWLFTDAKARKVIYTNLDPGEYEFVVKTTNNDGVWNDEGLSLRITILPPFWKTKTAFVLYFLLILCGLILSRQIVLRRERMKYSLEKERHEAQQLHELDAMKMKFFTNVSHEFRTPLSLIIIPLEKIIKQTPVSEQKAQFQLIYRNARRLLNMVNQLLDFRKMEVQEATLNLSEGDIIQFVRDTGYSFSELSEKKSIAFAITASVDHFETLFDKEKVEKILFNLLSNAFKFTPDHGNVYMDIELQSRSGEGERSLTIKILDSGIGIQEVLHERIFERFFQTDLPSSMVNQGSGIGLSIVKEFVDAHLGTITVDSEPGKGSCFTVTLPVPDLPSLNPLPRPGGEGDTEEDPEGGGTGVPLENRKQTLLLVEDNEDFRFYLKDNLKEQYSILEAGNGQEAWVMALEKLPDLIVSDVMMPEMNGIELCKKIKNEQATSHIPVILLTARAAEEQKIEGFEMGADDYITKPFSFEILQSRIRNLLHQRALFHREFRKQIEVKPSMIHITSLDETLIKNAIQLVEDNISNVNFSVESFSEELGISRVQLYKKLVSLTGKAPLEFIRTIRIQRAAQLLEKSQLSVSQVAYKVGFNNPKYFTKYFKDEYGVLPSAYATRKRRAG